MEMKKGRLYGMRCYLIGAMDRAIDNGVEWRLALTPFLAERGIVVLDPCDKPIQLGLERIEDKTYRNNLKQQKLYDALTDEVKMLRLVDLRMVDMSDFLICNIDTSIHMCGSYEEITWANRIKRPILVHCEQGKEGVPDWLFGEIVHKMFFETWDEMKNYLDYMHSTTESVSHHKRWMFFNYERLTPQGQMRYLMNKGVVC